MSHCSQYTARLGWAVLSGGLSAATRVAQLLLDGLSGVIMTLVHESSLPAPTRSVLAEVEDRVLQRARVTTTQLAPRLQLEVLLREEIALLRDSATDRLAAAIDLDAAYQRALNNLVGYGPLQVLLDDPDVWEIAINAPDAIFVKRHIGQSGYHHETFHDDDHVSRIVTRVLEDNSLAQRTLDSSLGLQDAQLLDGSRMHVVHSDIGRGGHVLVNIRRHTGVQHHNLASLVDRGTLSDHAARFLRECARVTATVIFSGAPGSGKTTMLSCCASELRPDLRVVIAEEVFETNVPGLDNVAHMQTRPARPDREEVDLRRLASGFLRMAPDIAIVGEVRDREALPLLLTLSSGVKGYTTIHAGSARQALTRLRFICQLDEVGANVPLSALNTLVNESIDLVVHCRRTPQGPRVTEVITVEEMQSSSDSGVFTTTSLFETVDGVLQWTGHQPLRLARLFADSGVDIRDVLNKDISSC